MAHVPRTPLRVVCETWEQVHVARRGLLRRGARSGTDDAPPALPAACSDMQRAPRRDKPPCSDEAWALHPLVQCARASTRRVLAPWSVAQALAALGLRRAVVVDVVGDIDTVPRMMLCGTRASYGRLGAAQEGRRAALQRDLQCWGVQVPLPPPRHPWTMGAEPCAVEPCAFTSMPTGVSPTVPTSMHSMQGLKDVLPWGVDAMADMLHAAAVAYALPPMRLTLFMARFAVPPSAVAPVSPLAHAVAFARRRLRHPSMAAPLDGGVLYAGPFGHLNGASAPAGAVSLPDPEHWELATGQAYVTSRAAGRVAPAEVWSTVASLRPWGERWRRAAWSGRVRGAHAAPGRLYTPREALVASVIPRVTARFLGAPYVRLCVAAPPSTTDDSDAAASLRVRAQGCPASEPAHGPRLPWEPDAATLEDPVARLRWHGAHRVWIVMPGDVRSASLPLAFLAGCVVIQVLPPPGHDEGAAHWFAPHLSGHLVRGPSFEGHARTATPALCPPSDATHLVVDHTLASLPRAVQWATAKASAAAAEAMAARGATLMRRILTPENLAWYTASALRRAHPASPPPPPPPLNAPTHSAAGHWDGTTLHIASSALRDERTLWHDVHGDPPTRQREGGYDI